MLESYEVGKRGERLSNLSAFTLEALGYFTTESAINVRK